MVFGDKGKKSNENKRKRPFYAQSSFYARISATQMNVKILLSEIGRMID